MTLKLNQVARQIQSMGQSLAQQKPEWDETLAQAKQLLHHFSTEFNVLADRIERAETIKTDDRFNWVGGAPAGEPLDAAYPLPNCPAQIIVIASDGSQILPDQHAIYPYYLINTGSITYRHGSNQTPTPYNPEPHLNYHPFDDQGRLISSAEINVQRDIDEIAVLVDCVQRLGDTPHPIITLLDGPLALRVIDLPAPAQKKRQDEYIKILTDLQQRRAWIAGYIDRPRSTYILSLLHLASLEPESLTEDALHRNPFRYLTDLALFDDLPPGQRSALFTIKSKNQKKYAATGHAIHFFYLNVSQNKNQPTLARVEIPAWLATDETALNTLHAALVHQARLTGGYPYVLARADELAVISSEERAALDMMIGIEMRRQGLKPEISQKLQSKKSFRF